MRIESIESLVDWTKNLHFNLAAAFATGQHNQSEERARELLEYFHHQEIRMSKMVAGFAEQADLKALRTMVYDYEAHTPVEIARLSDKPYGTMTYDAIAADVFDTHNQIIELYRSLIGRTAIPEEQELLEALLGVELQETMQMSQQVNRGRDM